MKWLHNFLRGTITLVVTGAEPERFLNSCARANLPFWAVDRRDPFTLAIIVPRRCLPQAQRIAARVQCDLVEERRFGLPFFLVRFRKRYALIAGLALFLVVTAIFSRFILVIDIQGNQTVTTAEILSVLRQHGIRPGAYGPSIDQRDLSNRMLLAMDELSFFSLNLHGTRAEVIVRERLPKPNLIPVNQGANIVSRATGIITQMDLFEGQALCKEGDTVTEGELLISGLVDIPEAPYSNSDLGTSLHYAQGRIYARTWRTIKAEIPLTAQVKSLTGKEESRFSLNLFGSRMKFYRNGGISFSMYDKITTTKTWVLSDGSIMPLSLQKETFREYEPQTTELKLDAAEAMLKEELERELSARLGPEGEVLRRDFVTRMVDGKLELTLLAECTEQIGKTVPIDQAGEIASPETIH